MKSKYEISIWSDIYDEELGRFVEKKEVIIGSDTMTSENRARDPKLINNINGTNKFTFDLYYKYINTRTGEEVENPYVAYLVNERKIKVFWKDEWYDLLVKQIKEDQAGRVFSYTCEDCYVTELSRTGFELEFNTKLQNNIGTAPELIEKVIENTDWRYDFDNSDTIYQTTEESVYESSISNSFTADKCPTGTEEIIQGYPILIYYSCTPDINNLKTNIQFYYSGSTTWEQDQNDMLVINGNCFNLTIDRWDITNNIATAVKNDTNLFSINFGVGISKQYRAERYVQSQKTVYSDILERYVNVYKLSSNPDSVIYGYNTTEYDDALAVINLITNSSNFKNTTGWRRIQEDNQKLYQRLSPGFDQSTIISEYSATSFLFVPSGDTYNSGILNNKSYLQNGFIEGERYIFRIKAKNDGTEPANTGYVTNANLITPSIQSRDIDYNPTGVYYFEIKAKHDGSAQTDHWIEYEMECIKSCPYEMISSTSFPFGIFLHTSNPYWIEDIQFYCERFGTTGEDEQVRIDPGSLSIQSIAQQYWKYFDAKQPEGTTKDSLEYLHISLDEWPSAIPEYNEYQRYGTIEADNSNRFNILQSIAETFKCWMYFVVEHDEAGYIKYDDDNLLCKFIQLKREAGEETGIGFIYGVDLKSVTRNIKSDKISTKTIVEQNNNEFGQNGFCSIARSEQNFPKENFIYNFDYYIQQGLLDKNILYADLYYTDAYYSQLHTLNTEYAQILDQLINKKAELTKQNATSIVYNQYILAAENEIGSIEESLIKLAGVTNLEEAFEYAEEHYNDTKVQALIDDLSLTKANLAMYRNLNQSLQASLEALNEYITNKTERQQEIINSLRELNRNFYVKYSRFIQEGTWTSEDYWNDDLYYLDALQVAYESSRPQISYDINVLRLSELEQYSSKIFKLGDISYIQDVKYFGYLEDGITPYKEKVILTEITSFFDTPDKDVIKVQNYKTQFDDLFQRITASVQSLEFTQGKYAKAASIVATDGTIRSTVIQNTFNENKDLVYGAQNESAVIDNTGITVSDNTNAAKQVKVTSGGVFVTDDGGATWKNAIRGDGISTDLLTAGRINTEEITVYNGEYPSFRWDPNGLNAYKFTADDGVDTTQFVRFDQFGIYGMQDAEVVYKPDSELDIYENANFGLTWTKFFLKNKTNNKYIEISTDEDIVVKDNGIDRIKIGRVDGSQTDSYGMRIRNSSNDTIFECGNLWDDVQQTYIETATIAGWKFTTEYLESEAVGQYNQTIRIKADGNIGCYGNDAKTYSEYVYTISTNANINVTPLNTTAPTSISSGQTIYPFVSSIGKTKTQKMLAGDYDSNQMTYNNAIKPTIPNIIQIAYTYNNKSYNYTIDDITWSYSLNNASTHTTTTVGTGDEATKYTTYIYAWDLTAKIDNTTIFTIPYTTSFGTTKSKYVPASETKWSIDNNGDAIFHEIYADGGTIAGSFIDNEKIYQTTNGKRDGPIKTQLNSSGTATSGNIDYTILTDAINAAMATIGGVLLQSGTINGYKIQDIYNIAWAAYNGLSKKADKEDLNNYVTNDTYSGHTHGITTTYDSVGVSGYDSMGGSLRNAYTGTVATSVSASTDAPS